MSELSSGTPRTEGMSDLAVKRTDQQKACGRSGTRCMERLAANAMLAVVMEFSFGTAAN